MSYNRHAEHQDRTSLGKLRSKYWTTKQLVIKKLGREEDEFIIASDADVDAKLELLHAIKRSCHDLLCVGHLTKKYALSFNFFSFFRLWNVIKQMFYFFLMKKLIWLVF
jgi:hypothetical protein